MSQSHGKPHNTNSIQAELKKSNEKIESDPPPIRIPYTHPKCLKNLKDSPNGKIIRNDETIKKIKNEYAKKSPGVYEGNSGYTYIKNTVNGQDELYVTTNEFKLGEGSFGSAYLMQNIDTGEWLVSKKQNKINQPIIDKEKLALKELNELRFSHSTNKYNQIKILGKNEYPTGETNIIYIEKQTDFNNQIQYQLKWREGDEYRLFTLSPEESKNLFGKLSVDKPIIRSPETLFVFNKIAQLVSQRERNDLHGNEYIAMSIVPGVDLFYLLNTERREFKPVRLLDMAISMAKDLKKIHTKNMLHRDIKIENMTYDVTTHKVRHLDLGLAVVMQADKEGNKQYIDARAVGSRGLIAPEIAEEGHTSTPKIYNEKVDIYALGLALADLCGLTVQEKVGGDTNYRVANKKVSGKLPTCRIHDPILREDIVSHLEKMTDHQASQRPSLEQTIKFFSSRRENCLSALALLNRVTYLNVEDYLNKDGPTKKKMMDALLTQDEVWLVDSNKKRTTAEYIKLHQELSKHGLIVNRNVVPCEKGKEVAAVKAYTDQRESRDKNIYICGELTITKGKPKINYPNPYVSIRHANKILQSLESDIDRLRGKYGKSNRALYETRKEAIGQMIAQLKEGNQNPEKTLTYDQLTKSLDALQEKLYSANRGNQFLEKLGFTISDSRKVVKDLVKTLPPTPRR